MSLARRFLLRQLAVVALATLAVSLVLFAHERGAVVDRAEAVTRVLAAALADDPYVLGSVGGPDPHSVLQPLTDRLLVDTDLDFVTIMAPDGTRWTHPLPSSVGEAYRGDRSHALAGETWTSTERGNLGPSVRTIAPVRDEDGTVVALVATGVLLEAVSQQALAQLPAVLLVGLLLLAASATVAALGARHLRRVTHGWGPEERAQVHSRHDAVLNAATEGLLLVDTAGAVRVLNALARELLGVRAGRGTAGARRRRPGTGHGRDHRRRHRDGSPRRPRPPGVFELGVTTKSTGPDGRGVGLHLVREVVDGWGARIEHRNDGGAVFTVTVPVPHDAVAGSVP